MARKKRISSEAFVKLWNASRSAAEVAEVTGRLVDSVRARAYDLRMAGYQLKSMRMDFNVEALTRLAESPRSIDPVYFVLIWQNARSLKEVMRFTGMDNNGVRQKAKHIRQAGVPLKRFNRRRAEPARVPVSRLSSASLRPNDYLGVG